MEAENITVVADGAVLLDNVSARMEAGKVCAVLGPNGAGKTTLLKCLAGTTSPLRGVARLDGRPVRDYPLRELARRRAALSQGAPILFPFTALEIVAMGRNANESGAARDGEIARAALAAAGVENLGGRIFPTLSGGERQRVQLARALAQVWERENACLLLDEPASAQDLKHQHLVLNVARRMARKKNFAVCAVLHDPALAARYADDAILLKGGKLHTAAPARRALTPKILADVFDITPELIPPL